MFGPLLEALLVSKFNSSNGLLLSFLTVILKVNLSDK
jgi:hypothetical protein